MTGRGVVNDINWVTLDRPITSIIAAAFGAVAGYAGGIQAMARLATPEHDFLPLAALTEEVYRSIRYYHGILPIPWGWTPAALGVTSMLIGGALTWVGMTRQNERPVPGRGFILHRKPAPLARALRPAPGDVPGVHIHPGVQVSCRDEVNHTLIVGSTGAGKTTILWPILEEARARGDLMLIFDSKGDFTAGWPGAIGKDFTLLSPQDRRSARWRLGHDIQTTLEAQSLAETLIKEPEGKGDPMWANGARAILVGIIADLQTRKPRAWGLDDLAQSLAETLASFEKLKALIAREAPEALHLLGGEEAKGMSKTTHGFIVNLGAFMTHVINLGVAAYDLQKNREWSVRTWLAERQPKVAIMGYGSKGLSQSFISSVIEQTVQQLSASPEVNPNKRRIWLVLDEAPRAGKIPGITDALTALRSKGVRVVLGLQSLAQIRETYSKDTATTWAGQCGIKIIGNLGSDEDQAWGSKILGDREVDRFQGQVSRTTGGGAPQHNQSWERVKEAVLMPASFGRELRIRRNWRGKKLGPRALVIGGGEAAILDWGFPLVSQRRAGRVEAGWVKPGAKRPSWGRTPPAVVAAPPPKAGEQGTEDSKKKPEAESAKVPETVNKNTSIKHEVSERSNDREEGEVVAEHLQEVGLDAVMPGGGLVAKIIGLAADAVPQGQTRPATRKPRHAPDPEPGDEEEREDGEHDEMC
ncbi:MAG: type IV secretion system DNA-binding domain-containing protein [Gammaproteobacteria bacterium]|nr:type IV secretion system DNA-binding domain-containing protein [Gammaproteobacteria bacterium]